MPRYLRWIAAITSGITAQFAFFIIVGAFALGTGDKDGTGQVQLGGGLGLLATFGSVVVTLLAALAVNDWLATRYPAAERKPREQAPAGSDPRV